MSIQLLLVKAPVARTTEKAQTVPAGKLQPSPLWMNPSAVLALMVIGLAVFAKFQRNKLERKLRFEKFRTREIEKKLKLALDTIRKYETNPDLINSREVNLDYLRMRMSEETFHFTVINQMKVKVKEKISQALRPSQAQQGNLGVASKGRQVDEIFDVEYQTGTTANKNKWVLFRIQIRLAKLPTQSTSSTISQIIDCIETYLSPGENHDTWQPTIQGRIVYMHWDQNAKPTPMLVIDQSMEGVNVTFRTRRQPLGSNPPDSEQSSAAGKK